ncbi:MAG: substrate-binding domain-containing protein [Desulfobacterales bacterium]|nr:substrate-binding domain-containing protein [Desulfobacterales bacterium]
MKKQAIVVSMLILIIVLSVKTIQAGGAEKQRYNAVYGTGETAITLATGSPGALGLLKALAEPFCNANHCRINWIKRGSGASLRALKAGEADMVMVHAPAAEKKAVEDGWATMRTLLGSNEFYIVGPGSDPAGISRAGSAKEAYTMMAKARAKFFSRGDSSGTHKKEMKIWKKAGIKPHGAWYVVTGDFMGPTLMRADRAPGYFMTDSSTFIVKQSRLKNLKVLFKGDPILVNVYHALVASPERYPSANCVLAAKFVRFMNSSEGQEIVRGYGSHKYVAALYKYAEYAGRWEK